MSEAIKSSVARLESAVQVLDSAIERKAKSMKTAAPANGGNKTLPGQQDLFGGFIRGQGANANGKMTPEAVAARLDNAIHEVEKLLREG